MVAFSFNPLGVSYQQGLRLIQLSYFNSVGALEQEVSRIVDEAFTYEERLERGEVEWIGERDEDGFVIWSQTDFYNAATDEAHDSIPTLSKGFVPVIYHHWERGARAWIKHHKAYDSKKYINEHAALAQMVEELGVQIDPDLNLLLCLNNALKHNNARYGRILLDKAPHLFWREYNPDNPFSDLYDAIRLSKEDIGHLILVAGRSGPDANLVFKV